MKGRWLLFTTLGVMTLSATHRAAPAQSEAPAPPIAKKVPHRLEKHGHVRIDDYFWLRNRDNPEVIAYLEAENAYTEAVMAHTQALQEKLFEEIKGRIKQTDMSVPYKLDGYYYYVRYEEGKEYPIYCRKEGALDAPEAVILDANALAEGHAYFSVAGVTVSSGRDILAYGTDTVGRRKYTIHFKDLATGELFPEKIADVTGNMAWAEDNQTLFYSRQDPETLRSYQVYRHELGTDPKNDVLVFEETDDTFACRVFKTKSKKYLFIASSQTLSDEYRYLEADNPRGEWKVFLPRERNHEYSVDHLGDHFFVRTNDRATNFRLMKTPLDRTGKEHWEEVVPHRDDTFLAGFELFRDHLVVQERRNALVHLRIIPWDGSGEHYLDFGEPAYDAYISTNPDADTEVLRYGYTSMTTPDSTFDYNMRTREKTLLKQQEVLGGFNKDDYVTERLHAIARDGEKVPISLVYRKDAKRPGGNPTVLYGYGAYGISQGASFSPARLSLLERGFVYAVAHVRGGQELGRRWYEDGKLLKKKNTFTDFIDCAEFLVREKYARPCQLYAMGGSAGGLLMGAVMNLRPDLWRGIVARVPFVDVVTTMLDADIPLTTSEYDEWGDPNKKEYYEYILSYSPYDQIEAKAYPNLLVTAGLHDSQVQYWEPAKWVAKLRAMRTDNNRLLLQTNMDAGHGGPSGRYQQYKETALMFAFILDLAGVRE